eukprot:UN15648
MLSESLLKKYFRPKWTGPPNFVPKLIGEMFQLQILYYRFANLGCFERSVENFKT